MPTRHQHAADLIEQSWHLLGYAVLWHRMQRSNGLKAVVHKRQIIAVLDVVGVLEGKAAANGASPVVALAAPQFVRQTNAIMTPRGGAYTHRFAHALDWSKAQQRV